MGGSILDAISPRLLGIIERRIGAAQQLLSSIRSAAQPSDAKAGRDTEGNTCVSEGNLGDRALQPLEWHERTLPDCARHDQQEFLAAVTSERIAVAYPGSELGPQGAQYLVARQMSAGVVDPLEMIDIDDGDRQRGASRAT